MYSNSVNYKEKQPLTFLSWLQNRQIISTDYQENLNNYHTYLIDWSEAYKVKGIDSKKIFFDIYINLIKEVSINYTTEEERRFISNFDYSKTENLDIIIPFFIRKLKNICLYYCLKREKLKEKISLLPFKGTEFSINRAVRNVIINNIEKQATQKLLEGRALLPSLSAITKNLNIYTEELYSDKNYLNDFNYIEYDRLSGEDGFNIDINSNIYINFKQAIIDAINNYPVYLNTLFNTFNVNLNLSGSELELLKSRDFINYLNNGLEENLAINLQKSLAPKYTSCNFYYLSVGNTVYDIVSGLLFSADNTQVVKNQSNQATPKIILDQNYDKLYTAYELGKFFIPSKTGILKYATLDKKVDINYNKLSPNTVYAFPDPVAIESSSTTPITYRIDLSWNKSKIETGFRLGDVITDKHYQLFYPYESLSQDVIHQPFGISLSVDNIDFWDGEKDQTWTDDEIWPGLDRVESLPITERIQSYLLDAGVLCEWYMDIYGNEFGLYKNLTNNYTQTDKIKEQSGTLYIKTSNTKSVFKYQDYFKDLLYKYPQNIIKEIEEGIYTFFLIKNVYVLETKNYVIVDNFDYNFKSGVFNNTILPGIYIPKYEIDPYIEKYVNSFYVNSEKSLYLCFLKLLPSLSASNYKSIYPVIYKIEVETNNVNQVYPNDKLNTTFYSLSNIFNNYPEIDIRYIKGAKFSYKENLNVFNLTYYAYNLNNISFLVNEQFSIDSGNETLYSYIPLLHKPYFYVNDTNYANNTIDYKVKYAGSYSGVVGSNNTDTFNWNELNIDVDNYLYCSDINPVYLNYAGKYAVQFDWNKYVFGNVFIGTKNLGVASLENIFLFDFRDNSTPIEVIERDKWVYLRTYNFNNNTYELSVYISSKGDNSVVLFELKNIQSGQVEAPFELDLSSTYRIVRIVKTGSGEGVITGTPACLDCGNLCEFLYPLNGTILLRPSAFEDSLFAGWKGSNCEGVASECLLQVTGNTTVSAIFNKVPKYDLIIRSNVPGVGVKTLNVDKIDTLNGAFSASFEPSALIVLSAYKDPVGHTFSRFIETNCQGNRDCALSLTKTTEITALYVEAYSNLTLYNNNPEFGTFYFSLSDDPLTELTTYTELLSVPRNTIINLSAVFDTSKTTFFGFSGSPCSINRSVNCIFPITINRDISAIFSPTLYNIRVENLTQELGDTGLFYSITNDGSIDIGTLFLRNTKNKSFTQYASGSVVTLSGIAFNESTGIYGISSSDLHYTTRSIDPTNGDSFLSIAFTVTGNQTFIVEGKPSIFTNIQIYKIGHNDAKNNVLVLKSGNSSVTMGRGVSSQNTVYPLGIKFTIDHTTIDPNNRLLYVYGFSGLRENFTSIPPAEFFAETKPTPLNDTVIQNRTPDSFYLGGLLGVNNFILTNQTGPVDTVPTLPIYSEFYDPLTIVFDGKVIETDSNVKLLSVFFVYEQVPNSYIIPNTVAFTVSSMKNNDTYNNTIYTIPISSNTVWEVKEIPSFLEITPLINYKNDSFNVKVIENNATGSVRSGTVKLVDPNNNNITGSITVTQPNFLINTFNYTTFLNTTINRGVYEGNNIVLLGDVPSSSATTTLKNRYIDFLNVLEKIYNNFNNLTNTVPTIRVNSTYNGKGTVAGVNTLCTNNCTAGVRGVEFLQNKLNEIINNYYSQNVLRLNNLTVIEISKNFWNNNLNNKFFYSNNLFVETFGLFSSIVFYKHYGYEFLRSNSYFDILYSQYVYWLENLLLEYTQNNDVNITNIFIDGNSFANRQNLSNLELLVSIFNDMYTRFGMAFARRLWTTASNAAIPTSTSNATSIQNFAILCSISSNRNLIALFESYYKWTLNSLTKTTINNLGLPNYTF